EHQRAEEDAREGAEEQHRRGLAGTIGRREPHRLGDEDARPGAGREAEQHEQHHRRDAVAWIDEAQPQRDGGRHGGEAPQPRRSATAPQMMRPTTPAVCEAASRKPALTGSKAYSVTSTMTRNAVTLTWMAAISMPTANSRRSEASESVSLNPTCGIM